MRAIVINPWDQTVIETEHNGDYRDYYRLLSGPTREGMPNALVRSFDIATIGDPDNHLLFVDDEGLFAEPQAFFTLVPTGALFAGRGVVVRSNGGEYEEGATIGRDQVEASIAWLPIGTEVEIPPVIVESFDTIDEMLARLDERPPSARRSAW